MSKYIMHDCDMEVNSEELRIIKKSISRKRHLNELKARKRAEESAKILNKRYHKTCWNLTLEEDLLLGARVMAAEKKVARIK